MRCVQSDKLPVFAGRPRLLSSGEDRHKLFVRTIFEQPFLIKCPDEAESQNRGQEVAEFTADNRIIILHASHQTGRQICKSA